MKIIDMVNAFYATRLESKEFGADAKQRKIKSLSGPSFKVVSGRPLVPTKDDSVSVEAILKSSDLMLTNDIATLLVEHVLDSLDGKRHIVLFGDFDVDGTSSASIATLFLRLMGVSKIWPIISKRSDGYGLTPGVARRIQEDFVSKIENGEKVTVITMDLGISSYQEARFLLESGFDVIVLDHHVPKPGSDKGWAELIERFGASRVGAYDALLNGFGDASLSSLSAAGVTYIAFMAAYKLLIDDPLHGTKKTKIFPTTPPVLNEIILNTTRKIAAMAQASDCMPFTINGKTTPSWAIAKYWEEDKAVMPGVGLLLKQTGTASRIGWVVGPIINAAGRLGDADAAYKLIVASEPATAEALFKDLSEIRSRVRGLTQAATDSLDADLLTREGVAVLIGASNQTAGVVGINASRASDKFGAPALYLAEEEKGGVLYLKGSMRRGNTDFSCEKWILDLLQKGIAVSGGGHPAAAGVTLKFENLEALLDSAEEQAYEHTGNVVYHLSVSELARYHNELKKVFPLGKSHESLPILVSGSVVEVRALIANKATDPKVWAYVVELCDLESNDRVQIKIKDSDINQKEREILDALCDHPQETIVSLVVEVVDELKIGSRFERSSITAKGFPLVNSSEEGLTESGRTIFFTEGGQNPSDECFASNLKERDLSLSQNVSLPSEKTSAQVDETIEETVRVFMGDNDPVGNDRVGIIIDKTGDLPPGVLSVKRPLSMEALKERFGEERYKELSRAHGGAWNKTLKSYLTTAAAMENALEERLLSTPEWKLVLSRAAIEEIRDFKRKESGTQAEKVDVSPFDIPFLKATTKPLGFQYADVRFYLQRPIAISQNDMGTGKTLEALMWACVHSNQKSLPVLVVTMNSIAPQYAAEIERYTTLNPVLITSESLGKIAKSKGSKSLGIPTGPGIVVTTYSCMRSHPELLSGNKWAGVVLDEAHEVKNESTQQGAAIFGPRCDLAPLNGAPLLAMSGTLAKNRPRDLLAWIRITKADGGVYTSGSLSEARNRFESRFDGMEWKEQYSRKQGRYVKKEYGVPQNGSELKKLLSSVSVRRLKTEIGDIPKITLSVERIASSGLYRGAVDLLRSGKPLPKFMQDVFLRNNLGHAVGLSSDDTEEAKETEHMTNGLSHDEMEANKELSVATLAGRLALVSSLDKALGVVGTLRRLGWLELDSKGGIKEPFVVVAMHRSAVNEVCYQLKEAKINVLSMTYANNQKERDAAKEAFQRGDGEAFVTTYGIGGVGLNLTRANRILLIGLPWTETAISQARDRVHRIGQNRPVEAVVGIMGGSIDEATWALITEKGRANFAVRSIDSITKGKIPDWVFGSDIGGSQEANQSNTKPSKKTTVADLLMGVGKKNEARKGYRNTKNLSSGALLARSIGSILPSRRRTLKGGSESGVWGGRKSG